MEESRIYYFQLDNTHTYLGTVKATSREDAIRKIKEDIDVDYYDDYYDYRPGIWINRIEDIEEDPNVEE